MDALFHAEESDRLKSAFLANISHEIRTPLNSIVGFSEVLPMAENAEEYQRLVDHIRQSNAQLLHIFDDIVNMSKLEARGGGEIKLSEFRLQSLMISLKEKYAVRADMKGLTLQIKDDASMPVLHTDRDRLREILNQYIDNALKFTTAGTITLGCDDLKDRWRIWVKDTGQACCWLRSGRSKQTVRIFHPCRLGMGNQQWGNPKDDVLSFAKPRLLGLAPVSMPAAFLSLRPAGLKADRLKDRLYAYSC